MVYGGLQHFLVVHGSFMVARGGLWWFTVVCRYLWWFEVACGSSWWFVVVVCGCS